MTLLVALVVLGIIGIVIQYLMSMGWYLVVKKHWSIYVPEVLAFLLGSVALIGMIIFTNNADSMPYAIAYIFGAAFAVPITISSVIASGLVFMTTMILTSPDDGSVYSQNTYGKRNS